MKFFCGFFSGTPCSSSSSSSNIDAGSNGICKCVREYIDTLLLLQGVSVRTPDSTRI